MRGGHPQGRVEIPIKTDGHEKILQRATCSFVCNFEVELTRHTRCHHVRAVDVRWPLVVPGQPEDVDFSLAGARPFLRKRRRVSLPGGDDDAQSDVEIEEGVGVGGEDACVGDEVVVEDVVDIPAGAGEVASVAVTHDALPGPAWLVCLSGHHWMVSRASWEGDPRDRVLCWCWWCDAWLPCLQPEARW